MLESKTKTIQAYAVQNVKGPLLPFSYEPKSLGPNDIEVLITHCGICHSDLHLINNDWNISKYPLIPGHEIIGEILQKGELVPLAKGQRVGIGWQCGSCYKCEFCHLGKEHLCQSQQATCVNHYGGFAEKIIVDHRFAIAIPATLASVTAAPLLCAGITVFSPLLHHQLNPTKKVGIAGIGGLGHLAIQFANAFGAEVFSFSSNPRKKKEALSFGATHFNTIEEVQNNKRAALLDLLLITSVGALEIEKWLSLLRPEGHLVVLGVVDPLHLSAMELISGRKILSGSNIGSPWEIHQMLALAARKKIEAKVELFPLSRAEEALEKMRKNELHYRAVLIPDF